MTHPQRGRALALSALLAGACATPGGPTTELHAMPSELARAISPAGADPARPGELAEAALSLLDSERAGGPDYAGAARMCLLAVEISDPREERALRRACQRVAARRALRSGDRELHGELGAASARIPRDLRWLLPPREARR